MVPLWPSAPYWPLLQLREYEFMSFIKEHLVFDNVEQSVLAAGNSGFGPLGLNGFRTQVIAFRFSSVANGASALSTTPKAGNAGMNWLP